MTSKIEWTDATWNPTAGCDRVSPGCDHCYAMAMAKRLKGMGQAKYQQDGDPRTSGPGFLAHEWPDALEWPLTEVKPLQIFVDSMADLFHDNISDDYIAQVWAVMSLTPQHTFQVLTKRHARMRALTRTALFRIMVNAHRMRRGFAVLPDSPPRGPSWPLSNVWLGVSIESQQWADIRTPALLDTPAAVRFLSCEPLLGAVDLTGLLRPADCSQCGQPWEAWACGPTHALLRHDRGIGWVIAGGESGPGARPMDPDWARSLRDQCRAAGVPFLFKQWGAWAPRCRLALCGHRCACNGTNASHPIRIERVGKKAAGRELDGRTWDEFPTVVR